MQELVIPAALLLVYAALHDVAVRTVPNWPSAALVVLGISLRLVDHSLLPAIAVACGFFVVLFGIWVAGFMGGGDVKLWAAAALLIPPNWREELNFILYVVILGGALAVLYLLLSLVVPRVKPSREGGWLRRFARAEIWRISRRGPLPYACAISGGALLVLMPHAFQP